MEERHFEYDVAFSFAEEDRAFVEHVAEQLKHKNLKVFLDDYERVNTWGKDLYVHLDDVYRNKAQYCVMFISKHYKRKLWTQHERESAQARAFIEDREYILPFRLDDTPIAGLRDTIAYLSINNYDPKKLAEAIVDKLNKRHQTVTGTGPEKKFSEPEMAAFKPPTAESALTRTVIKKADKPSILKRITSIFSKRIQLVAVAAVIGGSAIFGFTDKLTPVDTLSQRMYEKSKRTIKGAVCRDGWHSRSHGPGTCSHHGGVDHYLDSVAHDKTMEQCKEEAAKISWLVQ